MRTGRRKGSARAAIDPELMAVALREAQKAEGRTRPNPMVGAVVAQGGRVIAVGHHVRAGAPHAEVVALERAGRAARGADLYVTLEPCNHHGRTPPCTDAIIAAGVNRVIVGARDPNPLVLGKGIRRLERAGVHVEVGVLAEASGDLNRAFEHYVRTKTPYVIVKLAESLDGRAATRTGESKWITGEAARRAGWKLRNTADAIVAGVGTVLADDPELTCRLRGGRDPIRVIVDTRARTPISARVLRLTESSKAPTWIAVGKGAPARRRRALEAAGAEVIVCREHAGRVDLRHLLRALGERELLSILVEGGPSLAGAFFDHGLVHEVHAFIAPMLIGGDRARSALAGMGVARLERATRLARVQYETVGDDLHVSGRVPPRRRKF